MTDDSTTAQRLYSPAKPSPELRRLEKLVGTWKVSGPDIDGHTTYEWMEGGYFLIQHFDFIHAGRRAKGIEIIGRLKLFGEAPGTDIKSRVYDTVGNTLDYVYELEGDTLTIWGGEKGSPAYYKATFSEDGNTLSGAWVYPGGGGYGASLTRI